MKFAELKEVLTAKNAWSELQSLVCEGKYVARRQELNKFQSKLGLKYEFVHMERTAGSGDYDGYLWVFKLDGELYAVDGYYNSYEGTTIESIRDLYPVKEEEKVIKVWTAL